MSNLETDASDATPIVDAYVEGALSTEWQRKSSFETRAIGVIGATVSIATLFLLLVERFGLRTAIFEGWSYRLSVLAVAALLASTGLAVGAAAPGKYKTLDGGTAREFAEAAVGGHVTALEARKALLLMKVDQLANYRRTNAVKAGLSFLSIIALGVGAAALTVAAVLA